MKSCKFNKAWQGYCKKQTVDEIDYCEEHSQTKCAICGEQATHDCEETFQFVCGTPLCNKETCKIKHHAERYLFTPKKWAEIYEIEVTEEMFAGEWEQEINFEVFKKVVTRPIREHIAKIISEELNKNELFDMHSFGSLIFGKYEDQKISLDIRVNL